MWTPAQMVMFGVAVLALVLYGPILIVLLLRAQGLLFKNKKP